ncbi:S-adenosyl-L-methionine-dependent methyltransferase [Amanita rubescens]|nr:S-adenosyl-L-methionine-dependent methyltransferase [Amanita rubescens]
MSNVTPWNRTTSHPTLREAVEGSGIAFPKGRDKRALVPGCGQGRDVIYLASTLGIHTTGLDISPTAIERATSLELISYNTENFFDLKPQTDVDSRYDLIYDYTFFVAIHPSQRSEWGTQMAALKDHGPPWYVRPDHYDELLAGNFEKVLDKVPEKLPEGWPEGRQHLLVWKRL